MPDIFPTIKRPTLLLDEKTARRNLHSMALRARQAGARFRPHFKTHQSAAIGEWFRDLEINAITVSSVEMAQYFARAGWQDILIAFPFNWREIDEVNQLASQIHLGLLVESRDTARFLNWHLNYPVDVWIKIDVGSQRTGLAWDNPEAVQALAADLQRGRQLRLRGLLTHAGHSYRARGAEEVCGLHQQSMQRLTSLRDQLTQAGLPALEISIGDTPSCSLCDCTGADELRPGNFLFYDVQQSQIGSCQPADIAVALACPVVALHPERNEVVVFGGAIHLSKDAFDLDGRPAFGLVCLPQPNGWGAPLPGAFVRGLSQEHGVLHLPEEELARMRVGDLLCILPAHSCLTVTLMRSYLTLAGQVVPTMHTTE